MPIKLLTPMKKYETFKTDYTLQPRLEKMDWKTHDLVTIFYGEETKTEEVGYLENWLKAENPKVEVEVYPGMQPLYYYIFSVE